MLCIFCGQDATVVDETDNVCEWCCGWLVDEMSPKLNMCPTCYLVTNEVYDFNVPCLCHNPQKLDFSKNKRYTVAELKTMYGSVPKVICAPYTTPEGYQLEIPDIPLFPQPPRDRYPEQDPEGSV